MSVRIRMYRAGLGDCFLLAFDREGAAPYHVMIDCGVHSRSPAAVERLRRAAEDIEATLPKDAQGRAQLDLLVATHEHWDHLSGFAQARDVFDRIDIAQIWLPWTEDERHPLARRLRGERAERLRALAGAGLRLQGLALGGTGRESEEFRDLAQRLRTALDFFGVEDAGDAADLQALGVSGTARTAEALRYLLQKGNVRFCRPDDQVITLPGLDAVRFYVLGPPEDEKLLKKDQGKSETYETSARLNVDLAFRAALQPDCRTFALSPEDDERQARSFPFDSSYRRALDDAPPEGLLASRYRQGEAWRRIDQDWLGYAEQLALNLDSDTNNTSLALAIELVDSKKVLLFPADAQVGNWLSWKQRAWKVPSAAGLERITTRELLSRTVLYKTGHHGSHNATLRAEGLELMTSPELVAMIPTDEQYALRQGSHGWKMPYQPLYERLQERTKGRILRADTDWPKDAAGRPEGLTPAEWSSFQQACKPTDTFIEYRVS